MKKSNLLKFIMFMGLISSINLVFSQNPNWQMNSANYSLDASIIGQLKIDDTIVVDINDQIALFDNNNIIRGLANVSYNSNLNMYLFFLTAHSNTNGDKMHFKIYDASENKVISSNQNINFEPNKIYGTIVNPLAVNGENTLSVSSNNTINNLSLYPNPTVNNIKISATETIQSVTVFSIVGKKFKEIILNNKSADLDLKGLKNGVYFFRISTANNKIITKKIIKTSS